MPRLLIGTSGWNYPEWKHDFYAGVPQRDWLAYAARRFTALEINGTFYREPSQATQQRWLAVTPAEFPFAAKGHRFLTHRLRLDGDVAASLRLQKAYLAPLAPRLAAMLWQLPAGQQRDLRRLEAFAAALTAWPETRHVVEFRHTSWFDDEVAAILTRHRIANCISDAADWPCWMAVTTDLVYVRLHGRERTYASGYAEAELATWADRLAGWRTGGAAVQVYFDNTMHGAAPRNATRLLAMTGAAPAAQ